MQKKTTIYAVTLSTILLLTLFATSLTPTYAQTFKKGGTTESIQDPGIGHESHQLAIILPPSEKTYSGILYYSATENVQLVSLKGPLDSAKKYGGPTWTPDGKTIFALTFVDPHKSVGKWSFSGNALAVHTMKTNPFTVQYSVQYKEIGPKIEVAEKSVTPQQPQPTITEKPFVMPSIKFDKTSYKKGEKFYVEVTMPPSYKDNVVYLYINGPLTPKDLNPGIQSMAKRVDASSDVFKTPLLPVIKFANPGSGKDTISVICHCYTPLSVRAEVPVTP